MNGIISPIQTNDMSYDYDEMRNDEFLSSTTPSSLFQNTHTPQFSPINVHVKNPRQRSQRNDEIDENDESINHSFRRILLKSPSTENSGANLNLNLNPTANLYDSTNQNGEERNVQEEETTDESGEDRRLREEADSEALARQLMAEEAMASYNQSAHFLQDNADMYSEEDLAALRAIMQEENPVVELEAMEDGLFEEEEMDSAELSYEALLNLGERIGDVKSERWAMRAKNEIAKLPSMKFCKKMVEGKDENDAGVKCLVCQFAYEEEETIRILPCKHYFHHECVDQWLMAKDFCPYCRQCIVIEDKWMNFFTFSLVFVRSLFSKIHSHASSSKYKAMAANKLNPAITGAPSIIIIPLNCMVS